MDKKLGKRIIAWILCMTLVLTLDLASPLTGMTVQAQEDPILLDVSSAVVDQVIMGGDPYWCAGSVSGSGEELSAANTEYVDEVSARWCSRAASVWYRGWFREEERSPRRRQNSWKRMMLRSGCIMGCLPDQFRELAKAFGVVLPERFLYEKES